MEADVMLTARTFMVEFGRLSITSSTHARPASSSSCGLERYQPGPLPKGHGEERTKTYSFGGWPVAEAQHASPTAVVQNKRLITGVSKSTSCMIWEGLTAVSSALAVRPRSGHRT